MKKLLCMALIFSTISISSTHAGSLSSTFDSDDENWRAVNDVTLSWQNSGGNPDGFLRGNDWGDGRAWYFASPLSWAGDWSQYVNGSISFDLRLIDAGRRSPSDSRVVRIKGNNGEELIGPSDHPNSTWTHYDILLDAETFGVSEAYFMEIMENVQEIWIRGEYTTGADIEGLDNVRVEAVPVPAAIWLLFSGIFGLITIRRKP